MIHSGKREIKFESQISPRTLPFLADNRVHGRILFPLSGYIEMAFVAADVAFGPAPRTITGVTIAEALLLSESETRTLQTVLVPQENDNVTLRIGSQPVNDPDVATQTIHLSGNIKHQIGEQNASAMFSVSLETIQARCPRQLPAPAFYDKLRAHGHDLGSCFQGIVHFWYSDGEALGHIQLPPTLMDETDIYRFHPALLDAGLQVLCGGLLLKESRRDVNYVPTKLDSIHVYKRPTSSLWSHALFRTEATNPDTWVGDISLRNESGEMIAELQGLQYQRVSIQTDRDIFMAAAGDEREQLLYAYLRKQVAKELWLPVHKVDTEHTLNELGVDSLMTTQLKARLERELGLMIPPEHAIQTLNISQLVTRLLTTSTRPPQAEQTRHTPVTGSVLPTPNMRWFFEQNFIDQHHFNLAFLLEMRQSLSPSLIRRAVKNLLLQHEALRLRFAPQMSTWRQYIAGLNEQLPFSLIDLSTIPSEAQSMLVEHAATNLQASLNLTQGPIIRFVLFVFGSQQPDRLLMVVHWLALDGLSQSILLDTLQASLLQLQRHGHIEPLRKTTSFKQWAARLNEYAQTGDLELDKAYWRSQPLHQAQRLPVDYPQGINTSASNRALFVSLGIEETRILMQEVASAYQVQMNEILLTALVRTFASWMNARSLLVELVGHGRQSIYGRNVDLLRTVGRLAIHFPVLIDLGESTRPDDALQVVKQQLRQIPQGGIGYGLLRYLSDDTDLSRQLRAAPHSEVWYDYKGQMYQGLSDSPLFQPAQEFRGPDRSLRQHRLFLIRVEGLLTEGRLQMEWAYSKNMHHRSTIETLAHNLLEELKRFITYYQHLHS